MGGVPRRRPSSRSRRLHGATAIDHMAAPPVKLGRRVPGSLAPAVFAIVELGCLKRPDRARAVRCQVELRPMGYPAVRLTFAGHSIFVEDAPPDDAAIEPPGEEHTGEQLVASLEEIAGELPLGDPMLDTRERTARFAPDIVAEGAIEDIVAVFSTPMVRGIPNLARLSGWEAVAWLAAGRVRFRGNLLRARELVQLLQF
jgi:hypothetical protein